jgi:predicted solute-binding protein
VNYLNMLPFFATEPQVHLAFSPSELNSQLLNGQVITGCSSVIAGLRAGLSWVQPIMGVAADGPVGSVFVEPLGLNTRRGQMDSWIEILENNAYGHSHQERSARTHSKSCILTILTSGASAQSLWIFSKLCNQQGIATRTVTIPEHWEEYPPEEILAAAQSLNLIIADGESSIQSLTALLVIGDPALRRTHLFPACHATGTHPLLGQAPWRIDLGSMWRDYCGLPCVFALWFAAKDAPTFAIESAAARIRSAMESWSQLDQDSRTQQALRYLESTGKATLAKELGPHFLANYLDQLRFDLDSPPYIESLRIMADLMEVDDQASLVIPKQRQTPFTLQQQFGE